MKRHPDISHISTLNTNIESHIRILFDSFLFDQIISSIYRFDIPDKQKQDGSNYYCSTYVHRLNNNISGSTITAQNTRMRINLILEAYYHNYIGSVDSHGILSMV